LPPSIVYGKISAQLLIQYLNDERKIWYPICYLQQGNYPPL
jgi:hypothetical protein